MAVMLFKQKIKRAFPQWLITRTFFDNNVCIKILLNLNRRFMKKMHVTNFDVHALCACNF